MSKEGLHVLLLLLLLLLLLYVESVVTRILYLYACALTDIDIHHTHPP